MTKNPNTARAAACGAVVLLASASAWAQDYTVTEKNQGDSVYYYTNPPTGAIDVFRSVSNPPLTSAQDVTTEVTLPFDFPYFGSVYKKVHVCSNGFLQFGQTTGSYAWTNTTFPISADTEKGMVAPYWDELGDAMVSGSVKSWTSGTAPNRKFVVSWEGVDHFDTNVSATSLTFQVHLFETTGQILFAYKADSSPTTWGGGYWSSSITRTSYSCGIQAPPGDTRYACSTARTPFGQPPYGGTSNSLYSRPPVNFLFDPRTNTYTGTIVMDRLVSDATGIGNSLQTVPLAGMAVEIQKSDGTLGFTGSTDATGAFSIKTYAAPSTQSGNVVAFARTTACDVRPSATGPTHSLTVRSSLPFSAGQALGTLSTGASQDANGEKRAPFNVALAIQETHAWAASRTLDAIPQLLVLYDATIAASTAYTHATAMSPASLRIASTGSSNPDGWDLDVVRRTYGRHVLASIAGPSFGTYDDAFDAITTEQNAFAVGFGCYLNAVVARRSTFVDARSASSAVLTDLESATLSSRRGPDVAGWVALALQDLADGAGTEAWDRVDGSGVTGAQPYQVADTLTSTVTSAAFYSAWGAAGLAGADLSRDFIHHGLVEDDAAEANDEAAEATDLGGAGVRRRSLVLNLYNEDWFRVRVPAALPALYADATYDRLFLDSQVTLEIRDASDNRLALGAPVGTTGPVEAVTGPLQAGDYWVRVRHDGGSRIAAYDVQVYARLTIAQPAFTPWTEGRPYVVPLTVTGGVPPYALGVQAPYKMPPGLVNDSAKMRVSGAPTQPGEYSFALAVQDDANPANLVTSFVALTVNPKLEVRLPEYLGFPFGRAVVRSGLFVGGTAPRIFTLVGGSLPDGISLAPATMELSGSATTLGSTPFRVDAGDVAGSASSGATVAVVAVAVGGGPAETPLAAGDSACGFWFDAVAGSRVTIGVATAKDRVKRTLRALVFDPLGISLSTEGAKLGLGKARLPAITCPESGRYYVVAASASGDATALTASVKVKAPTGGKGKVTDFGPTQTLAVKVGALPGAHLTFKATGGAGVRPKVVGLRDPGGAARSYVGLVTESAKGFVLSADLTTGGTWTVILGAESASGDPGKFSYTYSVRNPKDVAYSAD